MSELETETGEISQCEEAIEVLEAVEAADTSSDAAPAPSPKKEEPKQTQVVPADVETPSFDELPLSDEVKQAVKKSGYESPTPVQAKLIPHVLSGRDVLAQSQTGTGKTAAFALPILSRITTGKKKPQTLVLAPTRELAIQVAKSFNSYASCMKKFSVAAIYGGQDYEPQLKQLRRGVDVVVGTPGRVIDHVKRGTLDLSELNCLVLDEADEMLNMGFLEDVEFVLKQTPENRQIALFSATLPTPIRNIAERYLNDPVKITIKKKTMTADSIRQRAVFMAPRDKMDVLKRFLEAEDTDGVLIFTRTKDTTVVVAEKLSRDGLLVSALNGDMPQRTRERTIERLKAGHLDIVVATDVAARGLDVTRVSHVFNYDLPDGSESYVHRVGRTGRAGRKGEAIIFLSRSQGARLRHIEKVTRQKISIVEPPTAEAINKMRVKKFKKQIVDVASLQDLTIFKKLIGELGTESDVPMEDVAAALAYIGQRGKPFFANDRPKRKERSESRNGRKRDHMAPPEEGMTRYRIEVGHRDRVKPGNIVGAVANEAGIDGEHIGPIRINDSFSTIDLPEGMPSDIFETLQETVVVGRQLRIQLATESDFQPRHGGRKKGRSNAKPRSQGKGFGRGRGGKSFKPRKRKKANA